jgi:hypothetical protein
VLLRAFGPARAPSPGPSRAQAFGLAQRFDLAGRIGGRHPLEALASEVGARSAAAFRLEYEQARRRAASLAELTAEVAAVAAALGVPLVLLKFAALRESGRVADGLRGAGDVDGLVPEDRAPALASAVGAMGLVPAGFEGEEHQLPQLRDAGGRALEIHRHVPNLRLRPGGPLATAEGLAAAGVLDRLDLPGDCSVPLPHVLAAHVVAHGLVQHGLSLGGYPPFRMPADLIALGAHEDGGGLAHAAQSLVGDEVAPGEMAAVMALSARLAHGDTTLLDDRTSPEAALLRHFLASALDSDYRHSLRLRRLAAGTNGPGGILRQARDAVFLTDAQVDAIYGPSRSRLHRRVRRLARPFDLAWRATKYVAATARLRWRRRA